MLFKDILNEIKMSNMFNEQKESYDTLNMLYMLVNKKISIADFTISLGELQSLRLSIINSSMFSMHIKEILEGFDDVFRNIDAYHRKLGQRNALEQTLLLNSELKEERDMYLNIFEAFVYPVIYLDEHFNMKMANVAALEMIEKISMFYYNEVRYDFDLSCLFNGKLEAYKNNPYTEVVSFYDNNLDTLFYFLKAENLIKESSGYMAYLINDIESIHTYLH